MNERSETRRLRLKTTKNVNAESEKPLSQYAHRAITPSPTERAQKKRYARRIMRFQFITSDIVNGECVKLGLESRVKVQEITELL